jgi:diguanylate cyclase (GGDEF)-like protein/putative nucleotidyltransferase with HDIG domain
MGDVFTILALTRFGPGPALIMYSLDMLVGHLANVLTNHGLAGVRRIQTQKIFFNIACCPVSIAAMEFVYRSSMNSQMTYPTNFVVGLIGLAITWFFVNTLSLSIAISLWSGQPFWSIWREGLSLAFLNFVGSAAGAGLITLLYRKTEFYVLLLSLPIAVIVSQLYNFYIEKYEQARKHIAQLNKLYLQTVEALASAVDAKDRYTHGHIRRVQAYAAELAKYCGINNENELLAIQAGALLHDIGKIAIPEYILNKPASLTETEYEKMKIHPVVGANMLRSIEFPYPLVPIVKSHHERWDGNGYPDGLKGHEIPLSARILALVDCYDALTTNRPYRSPMEREKVIEFFQREAGRSYDPAVVQTFITNIGEIEVAGKAAVIDNSDIWGIKGTYKSPAPNIRPLEQAQPTITYGKALNADPNTQRELFSVFEFARGDFHYLSSTEVFSFMGRRLQNLVGFDIAVFYAADLTAGTIKAAHVVGQDGEAFEGLTLPLEQKLSGWVAANNQGLCNLPPFPDFLHCSEPKPSFQISAIAPMNYQGEVMGAISLYRSNADKFTEAEFRRLEIVASQLAIVLSKCTKVHEDVDLLFDNQTRLPNTFQLLLMFDRVVVDATRYEYPVALLSIALEDVADIRQKWGYMSGDEAIRAAANYLRTELRDTDLVIRYGAEEFIAVNPRMSRDLAENLKSRLQNALDHFEFAVRAGTVIPLRASMGIALFPDDGVHLEALLSTCASRTSEDRELRSAVKHRVRRLSTMN